MGKHSSHSKISPARLVAVLIALLINSVFFRFERFNLAFSGLSFCTAPTLMLSTNALCGASVALLTGKCRSFRLLEVTDRIEGSQIFISVQ